MHRNILVRLLGMLLILGLWAGGAPLAYAHDGTARVELSAERISAGADLEVRGINIAPELPITLALVGDGGEFALGAIVGDAHGDFVLAVAVPREAAAGAYNVRAFGANRVIVVAPLLILGAAIEEEGAQRDQGEPLLAPMPQPQRGSQTQLQPPVISPAQPSAPVVSAPAAPAVLPWWGIAALATLVVTAGLAVVLRRRATGEVAR